MGSLITKSESTKSKIIRALMCSAGLHEPWERPTVFQGGMDMEVVHVEARSRAHGDVHCCVCKHCRTLYVRRINE